VTEARREAGLTQKALAERLGVSLWTLDALEAGREDIARHAPAIATATGMRAETLASAAIEPDAVVSRPHTPALARARVASARAIRAASGRHLVLSALALLVLVRFFTEVVHVAPRALNFIDIPLFVVLGLAALSRPLDKYSRGQNLPMATVVVGFVALSAVSIAVNISRVAPGPVFVFLYGFLAPLGVYAAVYRLWPAGHVASLSRALVTLGAVQLAVVGLIDLPRFSSSSNPDLISGTFGTNGYQLVFFLLVVTGLLAGIFTLEPGRLAARLAPATLLLILGTIFLAQYRALLATTAITVVVIAALLGGRARGLVSAAVIVISFGITFSFVASRFPLLQLAPTVSILQGNPSYYLSKRLHAAGSLVSLYSDKPEAIVFGTGPGTFSSRAWATFAFAQSTSSSNVQGSYVKFLGGGKKYSTDVSDKYVLKQYHGAAVVQGSKALSSPFSSYLSLMAEVGMLGFFLLAGLYVAATARAIQLARWALRAPARGDPLPALLIAAAVAFTVLVQMALLDNWLEVTRVTFVAWILLAVGAKEVSARSTQQPA